MKKLILAFLILGGGGGYAYYHFVIERPVEKPTVTRAPVTQGNITEVVSATGQLEPWKRVDVGSQVSGVVQKMFVDFNSTVKEGQVLAQIDPTLLQVQVEIQQANIQRQESDIANQKVGLEDLKKQLGRTKEMFDKGLQNQQQLEAAELAVKNRDAQITSSEKALVSARASLEQAKMNVGFTTIRSPIDGVVIDRKVDTGQTVQSSLNVASFFVLITPLNQLRLTAGVDEADIGKVRAGMDVSFTVETYGQKQFWGTVDAVRLNATVQNNVVTYPVWIKVDNPDLALRPSLTASAKIIISQATNVTRIPNSAFRFKPNADMYTALGLEPPAAGKGRRLGGPADDNSSKAGPGMGGAAGANGQPAAGGTGQPAPNGQAPNGQATDGKGAKGANGQAGANNPQVRADGQNRQPGSAGGGSGRGGGGNASGGRGFGGQSGMANLTPEQIAAFQKRFGQDGRNNRGGSGGGRGGGGGQTGQNQGGRGGAKPAAPQGPPVEITEGHKIDEYFSPVPRAESRNSVWTFEEGKDGKPGVLKEIQVRLGVTDGTFSELTQGDVKVGDQLVTGVLLPRPTATAPGGAGSLFGQPQRGQPGFGGAGGGGGGNPGGGGGGGGRGGGGGGRGGL